MKLAIISIGGESAKKILEEAKAYFKKTDLLNLKNIEVHVDSKNIEVLYKEKPIGDYDCIYVRGSYKYALLQRSLTRALHHKAYMPISPPAFTIGHNKFLTLLELQKNKIPLPKTYLAATTDAAKKILEEIHYPIIMKIPEGTHGKGVMFADSESSARSMLDTLEIFKQPYILQEYIETGATDIRAIVVGDKVIACMKRKAPLTELRSNIHMGGKGQPYELDYDTEQIAIKAAQAIGSDVCAVDILETGKKSMIIEVNLSPGLKGITKVTKKNVAKDIAKFLAKGTKQFIASTQKKGYGKIIQEIELESKNNKKTQEILTSLNVKEGIIKLPKLISQITKFKADDEVIIKLDRGKIEIKKHEIK